MNFKAVRYILPVLVLLFGLSAIPVVYAQEPATSASNADGKTLNALIKDAEKGDAKAQFHLGEMYVRGKDYATAVKWWLKAAEQENAEAQFLLGLTYDYGWLGGQKDYAEAMKWYRKAAEQDYPLAQYQLVAAQYNLGVLYATGQGVKKDYAKAVKWFRKAAEQGNADAQYNLGVMYHNGQGVLQSNHAAVDWYYKAGIAYLQQGQREDALTAVDRIEKTVPGHFLAKKLTQKIYGGESQSDKTAEKQQTYFGTAWPVASGYAVTNNHVIGEHYKITLVRTDGIQIPAVIVIRDKVNDIVLLKPIDSKTALPPALPISSNTPRIGADVFTVGYPLLNLMGISPKLVSGHVNALTGIMDDPRTLQISVPVQAGNSGGPLLNMKGEVVGIVTYKLNAAAVFKWTGDLPQNVNYAIKANYIKSLVDSVPPLKKRARTLPSKSGSLEDVADRVKNSVMIVMAE